MLSVILKGRALMSYLALKFAGLAETIKLRKIVAHQWKERPLRSNRNIEVSMYSSKQRTPLVAGPGMARPSSHRQHGYA